MTKDLKIQVLLTAIDKLTAPFRNATKGVSELAGKLKNQKAELNQLQKEFRNNEAQIKKYANTLNPLKAKLNENTQSLQKAYAEVRRMEKAMQGMENPTKAFSQKLADAQKRTQKLKTEQAQLVSKLKSNRAEFEKNGFSSSEMGKKQAQLRSQIKATSSEIDKQRSKLTQLNDRVAQQAKYQQKIQNLKSTSDNMLQFGQKSMLIGAATGAALKTPVSEYAKAETAATNLKVAMMGKGGKVSEDFQKINDLATSLGNKLPGTTADFQNLMTMLVRQGMSSKTILGGTGEAAALLSVQLGMLPEQAAEFAAKMQDATQGTEQAIKTFPNRIEFIPCCIQPEHCDQQFAQIPD